MLRQVSWRWAPAVMAALFALLLVLPAVTAEKEEPHPIDKTLEICMEKDPSTAGTVACIDEAMAKWDAELNRVYKALGAKLDEKGREALKASQLKWIEYRDREFKVIDGVYGRLSGTMYVPMCADARMEIVRRRALMLADYLRLLESAAD